MVCHRRPPVVYYDEIGEVGFRWLGDARLRIELEELTSSDKDKAVRYAAMLLPQEMDAVLYRAYSWILAQLLPVRFPDFRPTYQPALARMVLSNALSVLRNKAPKHLGWKELSAALDRARLDLERRPENEYIVYFPLHARRLAEDKRPLARLRIEDQIFTSAEWKEFLDSDAWKRTLPLPQKDRLASSLPHFSLITTRTKAASPFEAVLRASGPFDLLRALVNLVEHVGIFQFRSEPRGPFSYCLPPPLYFVTDSDGRYQETFKNTIDFTYGTHILRQAEERPIRRMVSAVNRLQGELGELIVDSIFRFGAALDAYEPQMCLLELWQMLESVALPDTHNFTMDTVRKRISRLHIPSGTLLPDMVTALKDVRNRFVHTGWADADRLDDVNQAKWIAGRTIYRLLYLTRWLSEKRDLAYYYSYVAAPEPVVPRETDDYERQRRVVEIVLQERAEIAKSKAAPA